MTETFKTVGARLSNWGRWGWDDRRGTLNFVTAEHVRRAAGLVRRGTVFELSIPIGSDGPQTGEGNRINPVHLMSITPGDLDLPGGLTVADDFLMMPLQSATQWDGLAHVGYDGRLYNDVDASTVRSLGGAADDTVEQAMPGFTGRGVLLDVARHRGLSWLAAGEAIEAAELDEVAAAQGVSVTSGDAVAVRTGWRLKALQEGWSGWIEQNPGLDPSCVDWFAEHEVATVVSDNWGVEVQPSPSTETPFPLHAVAIRDMGMMLGEIFDLEELARDCDEDGVWEFLMVAPPLRVVGGVGSPVSPIAIK